MQYPLPYTRTKAHLFLQISTGVIIFFHGTTKLIKGEEEYIFLGQQLAQLIGFEVYPFAMGLLAAVAQTVGGALIVAGKIFRASLALCALVITTALLILIFQGEPYAHYSNSLMVLSAIVTLFIWGPANREAHTELLVYRKIKMTK